MMEKKMREEAKKSGVHLIEKTQKVKLEPIETKGFILDLGGGGEGIIGKLNGNQVISIDNKIEELEEITNESLKIVMDACDLKFLSSSFDTVTSFFTLMYIKDQDLPKIFSEAFRVLKDEGEFLIWDLRIPKRLGNEPFFGVILRITLPDEDVNTGYGIKWEGKEQDIRYFKTLASQAGFITLNEGVDEEIFFLKLIAKKQK